MLTTSGRRAVGAWTKEEAKGCEMKELGVHCGCGAGLFDAALKQTKVQPRQQIGGAKSARLRMM